MKKICQSTAFASLVLLVSGCASGVGEAVSSAVSATPDWFEERKEEVAGEGYPDLRDVPETPVQTELSEADKEQQQRLLLEAEVLASDPKAISPINEIREDPAVWAAGVRAEVDKGELPY